MTYWRIATAPAACNPVCTCLQGANCYMEKWNKTPCIYQGISWVERDSQGSSPTPSSSTQLSQFRNLKLRQNGCESHCTDKAFVLTESFKKPKDAAVFLASFSDQWNNYGEWLIHTQGEGIPGGWKTNNTWNKCPESDLIFVSWACNLIAKYSAIWSLSSRDNWDWNNKGVVEWELAALFEQCWVICTVPS